MVSFSSFHAVNGPPIYQQIVDFVRRGCAAGTISDGDELPSRRVLSALLSINPNTVQKAFRLLEEEGLITSHTGAKSCITVDDASLAVLRQTVQFFNDNSADRVVILAVQIRIQRIVDVV